jgi:extradiol dioxygenase family protein
MRAHLSLDVRNVGASVQYYQKVFGVAPQKQTSDYAKFDLSSPALNLSLVSSTGRVSSVNHLGIEVDSLDEIAMWKRRLQDQGILQKVEENLACCFARQDKLWFSDPDGNAWEVFTVHEQLAVTGPLSNTGCCVPKSQGDSEPAMCRQGPGDSKTGVNRTLLPLSIALVVFLLAAPLAWALGDASHPRPDGSPVVFVARDYGFTGPDRIPEGTTTFQVRNQGHDLHHVQLLKLLDGKTTTDLQAVANAEPGRLPTWVKFVGGPNAVLPGDQATATMDLSAGNYALMCLIPDQTGVPHAVLGMVKPLVVTPTEIHKVVAPASDVRVTQWDFAFTLSHPIRAGSHTIEVTNAGTQRHEVVVVKLAPGATAKDFGAALERGGYSPPPGVPVGGIVGLERGGHGFFTGKFEPGQYGLICFFVDKKTGAPHFTKGMTLDFVVK